MRTEQKIKPSFPCLAVIGRGYCSLANASLHLTSRWREQDFAARPYDRTISPGLDLAFDNKQLASIGHPTLVPNPFGGVLKTETLTFQPVCAFALFPQDAAIERAINLAVARPLILAKRRAMEIVPTSN